MSRPRPDQRVRWSRRERALLYSYEREKPTSMLIAHFFEGLTQGQASGVMDKSDPRYGRTLAQELEARGYDLTTLRFSIRRKADSASENP